MNLILKRSPSLIDRCLPDELILQINLQDAVISSMGMIRSLLHCDQSCVHLFHCGDPVPFQTSAMRWEDVPGIITLLIPAGAILRILSLGVPGVHQKMFLCRLFFPFLSFT